jgi:hypothetical protein
MKIEQKKWTAGGAWKNISSNQLTEQPELVLLFGGNALLKDKARFDEVRSWYPSAHIISASTAGEIVGTEVSDDTLSLTAVKFDKTTLHFAEVSVENAEESEAAGKKLAEMLPTEGLIHVMVFSEGLLVNGTTLVKGLLSGLPPTISVTGGLAGDGARFKETLLGLDTMPESKKIVCVGFYGTALKIGYGSMGGWDSFGVVRTITKSKGNVLYEFDGKPALALYKEYLGEMAKDLPASGLLFPLSLSIKNDKGEAVEIVRTLLAVDEDAQSLTFAGDIPEGGTVRFMKANFDRLVDGASGAANMSTEALAEEKVDLAILISCIGRKLVLKERIEDEVEAVSERLGAQAAITGFYSYGEICPTTPTERQCQLHNQTMTVTTFREI